VYMHLVVYGSIGNSYGIFDNISVKELPQYQLPKAPFASGSTDELLDDKVNGLTTQTDHSKGDIVVSGNELVENGGFDSDISGWTSGNGSTLSYETTIFPNGGLKVTADADGGFAYQVLNTTSGAKYVVVLDMVTDDGVGRVDIKQGDDGLGTVLATENTSNTLSTYMLEFTANTTHTTISINSNSGSTFTVTSNVSVKLKDQSYIALQDTTAGDVLSHPEWDTDRSYSVDDTVQYNDKVYKNIQDSDDTISITNTDYWTYQFDVKFKPIPYVTKQVALLIEKTSQGAILNTVKPLVNCYGEESVETYESDIFGELGMSQKADRVWTDGSSEFILLGLKGYLNSGAYHPWFNEFGTALGWKSDSLDAQNRYYWYDPNAIYKSSIYETILYKTENTDSDGAISIDATYYGHPDSKFYDKCYINGQGGLICFSIPNANKPTYTHREEVRRNLVDGYVENGVEIAGYAYRSSSAAFVFMPQDSTISLYIYGDSSTSYSNINNGDSVYVLGKKVEVLDKTNGNIKLSYKYQAQELIDILEVLTGKSNTGTSNVYLYASYWSGLSRTIIMKKSPYLATMGTTTLETEIIGIP